MTKEFGMTLDEFLGAYLTPEGRKRALTEAVESGFLDTDKYPEHLVAAFSYRMEKKQFDRALPLLERRLDRDQADHKIAFLNFYKEAKMYNRAAALYHELGNEVMAVQMYLKAGNREAAEKLDPSLIEDEEALIQKHLKKGEYVQATRILEDKISRHQEKEERDAELATKKLLWKVSEEAGFSRRAIELAKEFGDKNASRSYRRLSRMILQKK